MGDDSNQAEKSQILYTSVFSSYLINYCSNVHEFWSAYRPMSPLTINQNLAQTNIVWLSKQFINQNCSALKLQRTELTKHLSNPMLYLTTPQTNLRYRSVLSEEGDHEVWGQSNLVWDRRLEDDRSSATKSGQISCSPWGWRLKFFLHGSQGTTSTVDLYTSPTINTHWTLWPVFVGHKVHSSWRDYPI
jgi:hypothetical protein